MYESVTGLASCGGGCTAGPVDCKLKRGMTERPADLSTLEIYVKKGTFLYDPF